MVLIEKTVEELVKKGEVNRTESKALVEELVRKGEETGAQVEAIVRERVNAILGENKLATKADITRIEQRLDALERKELAKEHIEELIKEHTEDV